MKAVISKKLATDLFLTLKDPGFLVSQIPGGDLVIKKFEKN